MRSRAIFASAVAATAAALVPAVAQAAHGDGAPIHPGVITVTEDAQCTSNFVFRSGRRTLIGQAAHCAARGAATETDGCESATHPLGTPVEVEGARKRGKLAYSSWVTMQRRGEQRSRLCLYNDFALVKLRRADARRVNPTVPGFGGPGGLGGAAAGDTVHSYQNSSLRGGVSQLSPKQGIVAATVGRGWSYDVYTATPGIPGDSGSGFMNEAGEAIGVLSTLNLLPTAGSNGVSDLRKALRYARRTGPFDRLRLVRGTRPFEADLAGAVLAP